MRIHTRVMCMCTRGVAAFVWDTDVFRHFFFFFERREKEGE